MSVLHEQYLQNPKQQDINYKNTNYKNVNYKNINYKNVNYKNKNYKNMFLLICLRQRIISDRGNDLCS